MIRSSDFTWIERLIRSEGFGIPPWLHWFLHADDYAIEPFRLMEEQYSILSVEILQKQYPTLKCVPFVRRRDRDEIAGLVLSDPIYKRGQIIAFDTESYTHYGIEVSFPSLDDWIEDTWKEIDLWHAS